MDRTLQTPQILTTSNNPQVSFPLFGYLLIPLYESTYVAYHHEMVYLKATNKCTFIYLNNKKSVLGNRTLKSYEEELPGNLFFRCHKSFLVNLRYIREVMHHTHIVHLTDGSQIRVSRNMLPKLRRLLKEQKNTVYSDKITVH